MAKLFASQTAMDTTIEAVQIGGNGYVAAEYHR
jgi:alkylation response protein AidB-like acyl-CoA dehydrogenase